MMKLFVGTELTKLSSDEAMNRKELTNLRRSYIVYSTPRFSTQLVTLNSTASDKKFSSVTWMA